MDRLLLPTLLYCPFVASLFVVRTVDKHFVVRSIASLFVVRTVDKHFVVRSIASLFVVRTVDKHFVVCSIASLFVVRTIATLFTDRTVLFTLRCPLSAVQNNKWFYFKCI